MSSVRETLKIVRRRSSASDDEHDSKASNGVRLSGTNPRPIFARQPDESLGNTIYRDYDQGWQYPDLPRGLFYENQDPGDRLQDIANSHLSEGPNPGRIPRPWNNRIHGKLGRGITGNDYYGGDNGFTAIKGTPSGAAGDGKYVPHTPTPRNTYQVKPYTRTVDDSAAIPGVYVADATRR